MFFAYIFGGALLLVFTLWYKFAYAPYQVFKKVGLTSPPTVPFFGNSLDIFKLTDTVAVEKWMRIHGKVFGYYFGARAVVAILDLDMLKEITIKQFDNFTERRKGDSGFMYVLRKKANVATGLVHMDKKNWKRVRPITSPTFSAKKMRMMVPLIEKSCHTLDEVFSDISTKGNSTELFRIFGHFTMEVILATAFGCQVNILKGEGNSLTEAAAGIFSGTAITGLSELLCSQIPFSEKLFELFFSNGSKITQDFATLKSVAMEVIEQRRQQSSEASENKNVDFLQLLMEARADDDTGELGPGSKQLTDDEIIALCTTFLLAGYETTSNLLAFTAYLLAMNPDKQEKLIQEIDKYYQDHKESSLYDAAHSVEYLDWVLHESLRVYPPAPRTFRICENTCTINGVTIPAGCYIVIPIQVLHQSVEHWEQPELFRPERFSPNEKESHHPMCYMPFGAGPRNCIGMRFALMEAKMCLMNLLRKYKFERAPDTQVPLKTRIGVTQSPADGIFLKVLLQ
ncbi:PREDICTED: cytochrome P450 3A24-like isoform X3 [Amphimedon queenslandica]|uniref:Cytochrome P450 n=1 Tax=Amphimedon queenslandica TaxID=400682 RepID=A0AAN0J173_AMPQE|nr:PREDICTED: cytochrome P450 3A24-like isoform X3 [Amphimedon queenslandica]|eukprot:XP_019850488.1 PREDICTED: cytochrome P450 3A24-like isoform X3 [Amphimedon queenslandica]